MSRGSTAERTSFGSGREERKLLPDDGVVEEDPNNFLYVDRLELHFKGDTCGELYRASRSRPKENMSADVETLLSMAKSGDVKSRFNCTEEGSRGS